MRVSGGISKGRKLNPPAIPGARPTSELMRGVIFNVLDSGLVRGARVLDLYAGIGSLGIESLSREAVFADFVEKDSRQCSVIRSNLKSAGFEDRGEIYCGHVYRELKRVTGPYRVILMDPPYRILNLDPDLVLLDKTCLLEIGGMLVVGHSKHVTLKNRYGNLSFLRSKRHGDSVVDFFIREAL